MVAVFDIKMQINSVLHSCSSNCMPRSLAIIQWPLDALWQLKSCQLSHNCTKKSHLKGLIYVSGV